MISEVEAYFELRLKQAWRDGTTSFVFTAHEIIERLIAIVPRPRPPPQSELPFAGAEFGADPPAHEEFGA